MFLVTDREAQSTLVWKGIEFRARLAVKCSLKTDTMIEVSRLLLFAST